MKRVCFFADVQYAPIAPKNGRLYDQGLVRLKRIFEAVQGRADLYVNLGDSINGEEAQPSYQALMELCDRAAGVKEGGSARVRPFIHVPGNHDGFALPNAALRSSGFRTYDECGLHWIVLDGNYDWNEIAYDGQEGDWTRCWIPKEQQLALQKDLAQCDSAIVLCHYNLDPREDSRFMPGNAEAIRKILEDSGKVQAVFQGHYHEGYEQVVNGIPYHTIPAVCEDVLGNGTVVYATADVIDGRLTNFLLCAQ